MRQRLAHMIDVILGAAVTHAAAAKAPREEAVRRKLQWNENKRRKELTAKTG